MKEQEGRAEEEEEAGSEEAEEGALLLLPEVMWLGPGEGLL